MKSTTETVGLDLLQVIIDDLTTSLNQLKLTNDSYHIQKKIEKNHELIRQLQNVYDSISEMKWYEQWSQIEQTMIYHSTQDPQISGFQIRFRTKPDCENFILINTPIIPIIHEP